MRTKSSSEQLGKLLNESKMQVTFTGWKAELIATEKKLKSANKKLRQYKKALVDIENTLGEITYTQQIGPVMQLIRHCIPSGEKEYMPKAALQIGRAYHVASEVLKKVRGVK